MEKTKPEKLAHTLRWLVENDLVPGLLPRDVLAAADLLEAQEKELQLAKTALAAKDHVVLALAETSNYRTTLSADFIITDPRVYHGEVTVDTFTLEQAPDDYLVHLARSLAHAGTHEWRRDIETKTAVAFHHALRKQGTKAA